MAARNPTNEETQRIIHKSLENVFVFKNGPGAPGFLQEVIIWKDILELPPVNKTFLRTNTLVATMSVVPNSDPTLPQKVYFKHLDDTEEETVKAYRDFLKTRITLH
ncbi:MAG: hypothetical protein QOH06_5560 [Acidobacteriota bacterium]|jgi:hypothetical protein|nr:hypothetical protein [Acidobacteriota bacterium]